VTGVLISFEGIDGSGKSTQASLYAEWLREHGREIVFLREPGGTSIGERIRALLLDTANSDMTPRAELFLYLAARAQITDELITPALDRGAVVILDRFIDSTTAYQGHARDLGVETSITLNRIATDGLVPDLTFVIDCEPAAAAARSDDTPDRMEAEGLEFMSRVRQGFLDLCGRFPDRVKCVDGSRDVDAVQADVRACADALLG
jgi:dTMP kinase